MHSLATFLFEHGHFQEKLQIENSIILLQRQVRKDFFVMVLYIVYLTVPLFFFFLAKKQDEESGIFSVENTVFSQDRIKSSQIWNFQ